MLKGSPSKLSPGKRKRSKEKRTAWRLTWKGRDGKAKTSYVGEEKLPRAQTMITNYKQARKALDAIAEIGAATQKQKTGVGRG